MEGNKIPLSEVEIALIRHGWPYQDKEIPANEWVLDYTAYLELGRYLDLPALQGIATIFTSPQIKARQTASFYFAQWPDCREVKVVDGLREVRRGQASEVKDLVEAGAEGEFRDNLGNASPLESESARAPESVGSKYIKNYDEVVGTYLRGQSVPGWEELAQVQLRALETVRVIADEAQAKRKRRVALVGHGLFLAALKQRVVNLPAEEMFNHWKTIPFGPYAVVKVNAFGDIEWVNEVKIDDDTDEFSGD